MNNSLSLSANSKNALALKKSAMTTKELAEVLGVSTDSVQNAVKKLAEKNRPVFGTVERNNQGGYLFNEAQATAIKLELQNHSKVNFQTPTTSLERQLFIKKAMQIQNDIITEFQNQVIELTPKAEFFDAVTGSKDCIEIGMVAKVLNFSKIGRNKLFEILRIENILQNNNLPYQRFIDLGYFRVVEGKWTTTNGYTKINFKTIVSQKGVAAIRKLLIKKNYVDIKSPEYLAQAIPAAAEKYIETI